MRPPLAKRQIANGFVHSGVGLTNMGFRPSGRDEFNGGPGDKPPQVAPPKKRVGLDESHAKADGMITGADRQVDRAD